MKALFLCAVAMMGLGITLACESEKASDDSNDGGHGGTGGKVGAGGEGAGAAIGGREGLSECADSTTTRQVALVSIDIPGWGRVWPEPPEEWTAGQGGSNLGGAGGAGGANGDPGCSWESDGASTLGRWGVRCTGAASVSVVDGETSRFEAVFDDESVVVFSLTTDSIADVNTLDFEIETNASVVPFAGVDRSTGIQARDESDVIRFVSTDLSSQKLEVPRSFFGANVDSVASCAVTSDRCSAEVTETFFEHFVDSAPEQRIPAREEVEVVARERRYDLVWIEGEAHLEGQPCADDFSQAGSFFFEAVALDL